VLWLLVPQEEIQAALRERAAERGVDPARLIFAPFVSPSQHLARLPQADLFLDTFPYGAHTTCSDALWMGLPVLTQTGRSFSARVAGSLLNAVGLPELAVEDPQDYETLAVRLAEDREALGDIRDHLWDQRRDLALFDNTRFCGEFESLVERIVGHWAAGGSPQAVPAEGVS
jgi:predicted O-linked N-acetylglucosamine transferase (SPINDLY family)